MSQTLPFITPSRASLLHLQQGFGCSRGTLVPRTEGISTAHPPSAGVSQTRTMAPHSRTTASPTRTMSRHGSTSSKCHMFREAGEHLLRLKNWVEESCSPPHMLFVHICTLEVKFWKRRVKPMPGRRRWPGFPPGSSVYQPWGLHFVKNRLRRCSGQSGNARTDGPLLDSSSSNSLWEEKRGQHSRPPKVHTVGEEEMLFTT